MLCLHAPVDPQVALHPEEPAQLHGPSLPSCSTERVRSKCGGQQRGRCASYLGSAGGVQPSQPEEEEGREETCSSSR